MHKPGKADKKKQRNPHTILLVFHFNKGMYSQINFNKKKDTHKKVINDATILKLLHSYSSIHIINVDIISVLVIIEGLLLIFLIKAGLFYFNQSSQSVVIKMLLSILPILENLESKIFVNVINLLRNTMFHEIF